MDRLIALVLLRWRCELRLVTGARSRLAGLLLTMPFLALVSLLGAAIAHTVAGTLERQHPALLLPALSAVAVLFGLSWALSPVLGGVSATATHDLSRLVQYPVALPTLLASSLIANVLQPLVLAQLPPLAALAAAVARTPAGAIAAFFGLVSSLALFLAAGQATAMATHALSRHRRWHDRLTFAGIGIGVLLSLLPLLLISGGGSAARGLAFGLLERDVFALVPFSWGARAAVHAARGELLPGAAWLAGSWLATLAAVGLSSALAQRLYRGELDLGAAGRHAIGRSWLSLPGAMGALLEKDLLMTWRDPRLKALVFTGMLAPALLMVVLWRGAAGGVSPGVLLALAVFAGLGVVGSNAFGLERQGLALLFSFPADRFSLLLAKNLHAMVLRLPALILVAAATVLAAGPWLVPAVATALFVTQVVSAAIDNFLSILVPVPVAAAGRDPHAPTAGARGLGAVLAAMAATVTALFASAPFIFLVWLPHLLGRPVLWLVTLPLALAGAGAVYFLLTSWAASMLRSREPDLLALGTGDL